MRENRNCGSTGTAAVHIGVRGRRSPVGPGRGEPLERWRGSWTASIAPGSCRAVACSWTDVGRKSRGLLGVPRLSGGTIPRAGSGRMSSCAHPSQQTHVAGQTGWAIEEKEGT